MPNTSIRIAGFILLVALCACGPSLTSTFTPHSAQQADLPQAAAKAIQANLTDMDVLERAGGVILGNVRVEGSGFTDEFAKEAAIVAAHHGGTHIVGPIRLLTPRPSSDKHSSYVIVKVPSAHWDELPPPLRPVQFEQSALK